MKEILKTILKLILTVIILILLIVLFQTTFNFFERSFVGNNDYYMIASKYTSIYGVIASLMITFLIFLLLFKNESKKYTPYIFNKKVLSVIIVFFIFGYVYSLFRMDVVYDDYIKSYSLFSLKGEEYKLEDIKKITIKIKKNISQTYGLYYTLDIEGKKVEIFHHATDLGLELEKFDHLSILNNKLESMDIEMVKEDKYLKEFLSTLEEKEKSKVESLFD